MRTPLPSWVINYRDAQWLARQLRPQLRTRWRTVGAAVQSQKRPNEALDFEFGSHPTADIALEATCRYNGQRSFKETLMKNGKKRRAWTSVQVRELKSMARRKAPAAKIAKKLKRSEGATRQKAFSIGLSLDSRA
jgi:hypothetical protein